MTGYTFKGDHLNKRVYKNYIQFKDIGQRLSLHYGII